MPHAKQATSIFALLLFLQAFHLCTSKDKTPSTLISPQVTDKQEPLDEPITGNADPVSKPNDVPEFDADLGINTKSGYKMDQEIRLDAKSGYNAGHASDPDATSSDRIDKKTHVDTNSGHDVGYDTGYESDPALDKNNRYFDFETSIQSMRRAADDRRGITWHLSGDELTRSVGSNSGNANLYTAEDHVVIALNIYRAAKILFELYKIYENDLKKGS